MNRRAKWVPWVGGISAALALASLFWLFRAEVEFNPALGVITRHYRWGSLHWLSVDSDRDGVIDAKAILSPGISDLVDGTGEYFEDWNGDGKFELRSRMVAGQVIWVEFEDRQGTARLLVGKEAREYLVRNQQRFLNHTP